MISEMDNEAVPELPADIADAWASVLLDLWEKEQTAKSHPDSHLPPKQGEPQ